MIELQAKNKVDGSQDAGLGTAFANGMKKLAAANAHEMADQAEKARAKAYLVSKYRMLVLRNLPDILRQYADLSCIDWPFSSEPHLQPKETLRIEIPGFPAMIAEIRPKQVIYVVPEIRRCESEEGCPFYSIEYGKCATRIEDDYEMALGHLWRRSADIRLIEAEADAYVDQRR